MAVNSGSVRRVFADAFQLAGAFLSTDTKQKLLNGGAPEPRSKYLVVSSSESLLN